MIPISTKLVCPPKRWEAATSTRFDSIRHRPWFNRLLKRKHQIPALEQALAKMDGGLSQQEAAAEFKVDPRELRDFAAFYRDKGWEMSKTEQMALDEAYAIYCMNRGAVPLTQCIRTRAKLFGLNPRALKEAWETNPRFYPTNYL